MAKFHDPLKPEKPFQIPEKFWQQLDSFCNGGWICFYVNEFGQIQVNANFDSEMHEEAIRAWATRFLNSVNTSREISETQEMLNSDTPPEDLDEEEG